jgi:hypothetical protein
LRSVSGFLRRLTEYRKEKQENLDHESKGSPRKVPKMKNYSLWGTKTSNKYHLDWSKGLEVVPI